MLDFYLFTASSGPAWRVLVMVLVKMLSEVNKTAQPQQLAVITAPSGGVQSGK